MGIVARMRAVSAVIVWLASTPAFADDRADAQAALERGVAAYRAGELTAARDELTAANKLAPDSPNPYRWLAIVEVGLGNCMPALVHVEGFLARVPSTDARIPEVIALRDRCLTPGSLAVTSTPSGASIRIDGGGIVGSTPHRALDLRPGSHTVAVDKPGFVAATRTLELAAGSELAIDFTLERRASGGSTSRWWLWAALGAGVVTAIGVTYAVTRDGGTSQPLPPVVCMPAGCQ